MSQLDVWLFDNYQLSRADLPLNIEKIVANASRYSKEHTLSSKQMKVDLSDETVFKNFVENWIDEVKLSAEEDEQGEYRKGEDMKIANAIAESCLVLRKLGNEATLDTFPFGNIPEDAQQFFCRALQKGISSSLKRVNKVNSFQSALVYCDDELTKILEMEF